MRQIAGLLLLLLSTCLIVRAQSNSQEQALKELKSYYQKGLISKSIYEERIRAILNGTGNPQASTKAGQSGAPQNTVHQLKGLWNLRVDRFPPLAPSVALSKQLGMVFWKINWVNNKLMVRQFDQGSEDFPPGGQNIRNARYKPLKIMDVTIAHSKISFKVKGIWDTYEYFEFTVFGPDEVSGRYMAYDPLFPKSSHSGPEFKGRLILEKVP